jgi:general secretion pathway protein M
MTKNELIAAWYKRSKRDRNIITAVAIVSLLLILYAYVWLPMKNTRTRLRTELPQLRAQAAQMELQAKEVAQLKTSSQPGAKRPLRDIINQVAEQNGMKEALSQVVSLSTDRMQVSLDKVDFDKWVKWVSQLSTQGGLRIESAHINGTNTPGVVKVSAVIVQLTPQ